MSNFDKLKVSPLPIDKKTRRVVLPAKGEDLWEPTIQIPPHFKFSKNALPTIPTPKELKHVVGKKRDRMTIIGCAQRAKGKNGKSRWVVRCDCGNFEHRTGILRWIGTEAEDMCFECRKRKFIINGKSSSKTPAKRNTI